MNFGKFEEDIMAKISVKLEAFYESERNDIIEVEISEKELDALKGIGKKEISTEDVVEPGLRARPRVYCRASWPEPRHRPRK